MLVHAINVEGDGDQRRAAGVAVKIKLLKELAEGEILMVISVEKGLLGGVEQGIESGFGRESRPQR